MGRGRKKRDHLTWLLSTWFELETDCQSEISKKKKKEREREREREKSDSPLPLGRVLHHDYPGPIIFPTYTTITSLPDLLGTRVLCNTALTWEQ